MDLVTKPLPSAHQGQVGSELNVESINAFQRVGLFIRKDDPVLGDAVARVTDYLQSQSLQLTCNEPVALLPDLEVVSVADFNHRCDLVIAIGGDGTLLSAARALAGTDLRIVGINVGRLGFLADVTLSHLETQLGRILAGEYRDDSRFLLQASLNDDPEPVSIAMNDVVIHSHQSLHMIEFETHINGRFLNSQRADGLVVSTPTGSTAYSMSAGGPIMDVDLDVVVLASVCPHTLSNRPLVVSATHTIEITLSEQNSSTAMMTCDGRPGYVLEPGHSVRIQRHPSRINLLHPGDHDHYSILRAKLEWGRKLTC